MLFEAAWLGWRGEAAYTAQRPQLFRFVGSVRTHLKVAADVLCVSVAILLAQKIEATGWTEVALIVGGVIGCSAAVGLYSRRQRARWRGKLARIAFGTSAGMMVPWFFGSVAGAEYSASTLLVIWGFAFPMISIVRFAFEYVIAADALFQRNVLVLGGGARAGILRQLKRRSDHRGFRLGGYLLQPGEKPAVPRDRLIGNDRSLLDCARALNVDEIVVAMDDHRDALPVAELLQCRLNGIEIVDLTTFLEREARRVFLEGLNPGWVIFGGGFRNDLMRRVSGRALDVVVSLLLLALAWPLMLITALLIKLEDGIHAPVFYRQTRVGLFDRRFEMLKFRSMRTDAESSGEAVWAQAHDERITRVGRIIRRARIDELPQLFNVLRGEMSVVGPRPERPEFVADLARHIPYYHARHSVKPGLAGWAQLCYPYGASEHDAARKLEYDLYYIKNHTLLFDLSILLHTFETVLFGRGVR